MIAEAIARTRAMIDFHGRALRLTCATRSERSTCLSCTRSTSLRTIRPNAIRPEAGAAGGRHNIPGPGKALGSGPHRPGPQRVRDRDVYLISAGPTGSLSL